MTCLHPVSGVSDAYLPSTSVYRFEHFDYMNHTLLEAFQGHDSGLFPCYYDLLSRDPDVTGT